MSGRLEVHVLSVPVRFPRFYLCIISENEPSAQQQLSYNKKVHVYYFKQSNYKI